MTPETEWNVDDLKRLFGAVIAHARYDLLRPPPRRLTPHKGRKAGRPYPSDLEMWAINRDDAYYYFFAKHGMGRLHMELVGVNPDACLEEIDRQLQEQSPNYWAKMKGAYSEQGQALRPPDGGPGDPGDESEGSDPEHRGGVPEAGSG